MNCKVIVQNSYYKDILGASEPGSAKYQVFKNDLENGRIREVNEAFDEILSEQKTLLYSWKSGIVSGPGLASERKEKQSKLFALDMDDSIYTFTGFGLQRDSEFFKMFNHYLLKGKETGIFNRLYKTYFIELYVNEEFGIVEPQPLGVDNVIFTFACLAIGFFTAVMVAIGEFGVKIRAY